MKIEKVMERVYDPRRLHSAWERVKRNAGAAGIDEMTVEQFEDRKRHYLSVIHEKLSTGKYRFRPSRRAYIPKKGSTTKKRPLGIPVVIDRVVATSMYFVLTEIFDRDFTESNLGFRENKSQRKAISHVREAVLEGYVWCASIDLENFFGEIPHGLILKLIRRKISDESFVTLIARALKAGVIVDGKLEKTTKGCPQGSPVSPILSNIVLNELDQELEKRGHRYCRWADDFLILTKSERAARRVMENITLFLEEDLGLPVNREKSKVSRIGEVEFLGFKTTGKKIGMGKGTVNDLKERVRELTKRNNPLSMRQIIMELNEYLSGWISQFRIQEFQTPLRNLDRFIRKRLRSMQLAKWKKPKKFQRMMIRAGYNPKEAHRTWVKMNRWRSVDRREVLFTLNNVWFRRLGLVFLDDFTQRNLELRFSR